MVRSVAIVLHPAATALQRAAIAHGPSTIAHHPLAIAHCPDGIVVRSVAIALHQAAIALHGAAIAHRPSTTAHHPLVIAQLPVVIALHPGAQPRGAERDARRSDGEPKDYREAGTCERRSSEEGAVAMQAIPCLAAAAEFGLVDRERE